MRGSILVAVSAVLLGASLVWADTVTLRDGTVREGTIVSEDDDTVTMEVRVGGLKGKMVIPRAEIASLKIQPLAPDPVQTEAAGLRTNAERLSGRAAADAWVALGDHYAQHAGYSAQAKAAYEKAIASDPDHVRARHGLGHVKTAKGWQAADDLRRQRGLVPLGEVWLKPDERSWVIDRRHEEQTEELRIGPRQPDDFSKERIDRDLALKRAEEDARRSQTQLLADGESLLARYGYYMGGDGTYLGSGPVWGDGVSVTAPGYSFFAGTVGTGWHVGSGWSGGHGCFVGPVAGAASGNGKNGSASFRRAYGFSPGFRWGNFTFGTALNPYGGGCWNGYGGGWGMQFNGGSGSTHWNLNIGGFNGSGSYRSSTGIGFLGF